MKVSPSYSNVFFVLVKVRKNVMLVPLKELMRYAPVICNAVIVTNDCAEMNWLFKDESC